MKYRHLFFGLIVRRKSIQLETSSLQSPKIALINSTSVATDTNEAPPGSMDKNVGKWSVLKSS